MLLALPSLASAQGYGARVTQEGFDALSTEALARAPELFTTPVLDAVLYDCPATERNVTTHVPPTNVNLAFHSLELRAENDRFVAAVDFDVDLATNVFIDNPVACFGDADCDVIAGVQNLGIEVELAAGTSPEGGIEFHGAMVDIELSADDLTIESEGCAVGEVVDWLFNTFDTWLLELGVPRLEAALGERITMTLNELLAETVELEVQLEELLIRGTLDSIDLSSSTGLTAGGDLGLQWTGETVWEVPIPEVQRPDGPALPDDFGPGMFQLAVSDEMVTSALYEAWRGGMIQRLLADQTTTIALGGDGVVQQLGLEAGTALEIFVDILQPLEVEFGREAPDVATIGLRELFVRVEVLPPSGPSNSIEVRVDGSLAAGLGVSDALGGLVLDIERLDIDQLTIEAGETLIDADRARLGGFVRETVTPMLAERLGGIPVAPGLHPIAGTFLHVRSVSSEGGWQRVGVDMITPNPDDSTAPDTSIDAALDRIPAGTARFDVSGNDDDTPASLLRYLVTLDGASLDMGTASSLRTLFFDVTEGDHVLEVAAVDLADNVDASPARHEFYADGTPPELTVTESPLNFIEGRTVNASWIATDDDEQPVWSRWEVREIRSDGTHVVVGDVPFSPDRWTMELDGLDRSELHELEIMVRDTAGNVTSQTFGFAINPSGGGCAASGSGSSFGLLLLLLWFKRRRA